jgi:hypothetical protein
MLPRTRTILLAAVVAVVVLISGCDIAAFYGPPGSWGTTTDPDLLAVIEAAGRTYQSGQSVDVVWDGTEQPDYLTIELALSGSVIETLAGNHRSDLPFSWWIPDDFPAASETADEYQIVVRGFHPEQGIGSLELVAWSERFTILPAVTGGLSDITVSRRNVVITLTDNGAEIDNDTIDLLINGSYIAQGHVLEGGSGTSFEVALQPGGNLLEIYAVNEGSITPNTALLEVTDVIDGPVAQEWRLLAGETGSLTVTAP